MPGRSRNARVVVMSQASQETHDVKPTGLGIPNERPASRILLIDDDPFFLRILQRFLSEERYESTACSNACEALGLLHSGKFHLVICDLRMPGCDGLTLLHEIRNGGNIIPVVILTAYGEVDTYLEAMNAGATEYLNKPINSADLLAVVRECLIRSNNRLTSKPSQSL